jgi:hypothetical protein
VNSPGWPTSKAPTDEDFILQIFPKCTIGPGELINKLTSYSFRVKYFYSTNTEKSAGTLPKNPPEGDKSIDT